MARTIEGDVTLAVWQPDLRVGAFSHKAAANRARGFKR